MTPVLKRKYNESFTYSNNKKKKERFFYNIDVYSKYNIYYFVLFLKINKSYTRAKNELVPGLPSSQLGNGWIHHIPKLFDRSQHYIPCLYKTDESTTQ